MYNQISTFVDIEKQLSIHIICVEGNKIGSAVQLNTLKRKKSPSHRRVPRAETSRHVGSVHIQVYSRR